MKAKRGYRVPRFGLIPRILYFFVGSPLTPLIVGASILLGALAIVLLPREEEPQIVVPVIDVFVEMPGATAKEVEQRVTRPLEKLLWEVPGLEYVYSTSSPGRCLTIVRFLVGWDEEKAIVQLYQKLYANLDRIPAGASRPLLKPVRIDDVPVLALTFHGGSYDGETLRRIVAHVDDAVKQVPDVSETTLIGGWRRQVRVELDPGRLNSYQIDPSDVLRTLRAANQQTRAGSFPSADRDLVETGGFLRNAAEVGDVVVGRYQGQLVYLRTSPRSSMARRSRRTMCCSVGRRSGPAASGTRVEEPAVT
jgi:multidrug efflux pump subunit AcrB